MPIPFLTRKFFVRRHARHLHAGHALRLFGAAVKTTFFAHVFFTYLYSIEFGYGPSMLPTFEVTGDYFIISRRFRRGRNVKIGDIVAFHSVVEPGESMLKRVIGMEGDYVMQHTPETESDTMIQVPQGHCWVVGDNLEWSMDSRHFGPLPMALIRGKIVAKILPWRERRWIEDGLTPVVAQ